MNLKENIKRILNESTFFRRRVDMSLMDKEFFEVLNYVAYKLITKHDEGKIVKFPEFKNRVIDYLIDNYHGELSDWGREEYPYVEVYEFLSNHFKDKIKEKYDLMFNRNINESEDKKSKLLSKIEEDGLYQIMQDTGLSLPQIYTKTEELPREVFERYIKDYIDENGYEFEGRKNISPSIQISNLVWIDYIYTSNDGNKLYLSISEFKNGNLEDSTDEYVTSLDNIDDEDVFNIVDHMTQIDPPQLYESKTLQENEEDPTQKILNFLLRRYEIEEHIFGDEDRPIIIKMLRIKNSYGQSYSIRSTGSKKEQIRDILDTLMILNVIDDFDFSKTKDNPYAQKAVKAVKMFYDKVMGNKSNMNETIKKEGSLLSIIKDIVEPFKEKGAVCDIDVNYDQEDDMYTVMINFGIKNLDKIFHSVRELQRNWYVDDIRKEVKNEIIGLMSIKNIYVGSTAIDSCDETINESKILDKIKSFLGKKPLGKKPLSKDDKIINAIVGFIKDNYNIKEFMDTRDNQGDYLYTLIDEHQWVFNYFTSDKRLHYSWKFAEDIHNWIGIDGRLLQPDSEMMGKIFEKLFNKKVNKVFGYSRL
jgi:hypothetical protein